MSNAKISKFVIANDRRLHISFKRRIPIEYCKENYSKQVLFGITNTLCYIDV